MARVTRARLQTAYDAGRHAAPDGTPPPDYIAGDPELLDAWDEGMADAQDGKPPRRFADPATGAPHRAPARPRRTSGRAKPKPAADDTTDDDSGGAASGGSSTPTPTRAAVPHPVEATTDTLRRITLKPSAGNVGGFILGMITYLAAIQYVRNGPAGPLAWFRAKFENKPAGAHPAAPMTAGANTGAGAGNGGTGKTAVTTPLGALTTQGVNQLDRPPAGVAAPKPPAAPVNPTLASLLGVR